MLRHCLAWFDHVSSPHQETLLAIAIGATLWVLDVVTFIWRHW